MSGNVLPFTRKRRPRRRPNLAFWAVLLVGAGLGWLLPDLATTTASLAQSPSSPSVCIADVHDGDTVRTCEGERIRIANIDAPEMRGSPKCRRGGWCDYDLAEQSRDALASLLDSGTVTIERSGTDRYGRTLAEIEVDGQDAGEYLIDQSLARPWL